MRRLWGDEYADNYKTFVVALNVRGLGKKAQKYAHDTIRRPAYALIRHGYFKAARELMAREAATDDGKRVFSPISLQHLLGDAYRKEAAPADDTPHF